MPVVLEAENSCVVINLLVKIQADKPREDSKDGLRFHHVASPEWGFKMQRILGFKSVNI